MALPLTYNIRNLFVRKVNTALTFVVIGVVVLVLSVLLSFAEGIKASLHSSGRSDNLLILKPGATAESTSIIQLGEADRVVQTPHLAFSAAGEPMVSREICVQTTIRRLGRNGRPANVAVRGLDPIAFEVHPEIRIIDGRRFHEGALECIVGKAARDRYAGLSIGSDVNMGRAGNRLYRVVGVFDAGGTAIESEILAPRTMVSDSYHRPLVSSIVARLTGPEHVPAAIDYVNGPAVELEGRRETDYYADLSSKTKEIIALTSILVTIMAAGAAFAVANTMYAAVDSRRREIAMLRTIGFSRRAVISAFVIESVLVSVVACGAGLAASLCFAGWRTDYLSDTTWTVFAYEVKVTPQVGLIAVALALVVGVLGALFPALRASRIRIIEALRQA